MSMSSPDQIELTDPQRRELTRLVRAGKTEQRLALRADIVLLAADGYPTARIAASLGVCEDTARTWRRRWCATPSVASLGDAKRSGRKPLFTPVQVGGDTRSPGSRRWPAHHRRTAGNRCRIVPGAGPAGRQRRDLRAGVLLDGAQVAVRGRPQTLAVPVLDLHHRSGLRREGGRRCWTSTPGNGTGNRWVPTTT